MCHFFMLFNINDNFSNIYKHFQIKCYLQILEIMKFFGEKFRLALMRVISRQVVEFTGKRCLYANSSFCILYCGPNGPTASIFYRILITQSVAMVFILNLDKVSLKKLFPTINIQKVRILNIENRKCANVRKRPCTGL